MSDIDQFDKNSLINIKYNSMKKIKLIFIAISGFVILSCEKEKLGSVEQEKDVILNQDNEHQNRASGATRTWYDYSQIGPPYGPYDYGCNSNPSDCFDPIIVTPSGVSPIQNVFTAVESGITANIITAFQTYYTVLSQNISSVYLDGVLDESYTVRSKGDFDTETAYLIFELNGVEAVYPYEKD